jgi:hypothetical protein
MKEDWIEALRTQVFAAWPDQGRDNNFKKIASAENGQERIQLLQVLSQPGIALPLIVVTRDGSQADPLRAVLHILDEPQWQNELAALAGRFPTFFSADYSAAPVRSVTGMRDDPGEPAGPSLDLPGENEALILLAPRGAGPTAFPSDLRKETQIRRRFMLLGQTVDGMRVWDIVGGVKAAREFLPAGSSLRLEAREEMAVNALYAALFSPGVESLLLIEPPHSHMAGPDYLNALKFLDVPQAAAMVAERSSLALTVRSPGDWWFLERISRAGVADFSVKLQSVESRQ